MNEKNQSQISEEVDLVEKVKFLEPGKKGLSLDFQCRSSYTIVPVGGSFFP